MNIIQTMSVWQLIILILVVLVVGYTGIRIFSYAASRSYFQAKDQYSNPNKQEEKKNGQKKEQ